MFLLKKVVGPLLYPYTIFLGLLFLGAMLLWFSARRKLAMGLVNFAAAGFILLSYPIVWDGLVDRLENRYAPLNTSQADLAGIRWIVVLGGGGTMNEALPATSQMSPLSQARLIEGIRILNAVPEAKLLLSGHSDAIIMQNAAYILGVDPKKTVTEPKGRDTEQQAVEVKTLVGSDRFVLVTSALHMPRAMALFEKQGLVPLASSADFLNKGASAYPLNVILPSSDGAPKASALAHEWLGTLWAKLWGRIE